MNDVRRSQAERVGWQILASSGAYFSKMVVAGGVKLVVDW